MATSHRLNRTALWCCLLLALVVQAPPGHAATPVPVLLHDTPEGFGSSKGDDAEMWVSDGLDGVIHIYTFRSFTGDFEKEFRRALFRDRISTPYREDRLLDAPVLKTISVKGADAALAATFKNFNGGARRQHFRVAILAVGFVALVDISANSPEAFDRNWPSISRLLRSLRVVGRDM